MVFFFSSRRRHTRFDCDWSSDVCSSDLDSRRPNVGSRKLRFDSVALLNSFPAIASKAFAGSTLTFSCPLSLNNLLDLSLGASKGKGVYVSLQLIAHVTTDNRGLVEREPFSE